MLTLVLGNGINGEGFFERSFGGFSAVSFKSFSDNNIKLLSKLKGCTHYDLKKERNIMI